MPNATGMIGPKFYGFDADGNPLAFGKLYAYEAGTTTPKDTWDDEDKTTVNPNPVILNGEGYGEVYLDGSYNMVLKDLNDVEIWSADPVTGQNSSASEVTEGVILIATAGDAAAATNLTKAITPGRVAAAVPQATQTTAGKARLSTEPEATGGTNNTTAMTPLRVAQAVPASSESTAGKIQIATTAEAEAAVIDDKAMTPLKVQEAIEANATRKWVSATFSVVGSNGYTIANPLATEDLVVAIQGRENNTKRWMNVHTDDTTGAAKGADIAITSSNFYLQTAADVLGIFALQVGASVLANPTSGEYRLVVIY